MMEHIRQFDWCSSTVDTHFVNESDLDNCVTEKILRNKFYDPLISSDSESEAPTNVIDWDNICKKRENTARVNRVYVPGLHVPPPFPKLSALTAQQHLQCLKVLCANNPQILEAEFMPRPTKQDHKVFEEVKEIYAAEQIEFKEWAKSLWDKSHRVRVLRVRPCVEAAYSAEQRLRLHRAHALPAAYHLAAQIPLATTRLHCDLTHLQDLINVNATELPEIQLPEMIVKRYNIIRPHSAPAPCVKHPCRFVLPNESSMSILPLPELNRELAQYALDNGAACIGSESALKCLLELDRPWTVPISVCDVMDPEGVKCNVIVLGSEFSINKESATTRTYRAFRHMVEHALISMTERMKVLNRSKNVDKSGTNNNNNTLDTIMTAGDTDTDDDGDDLYIDTECNSQNNELETDTCDTEMKENDENEVNGETENGSNEEIENNGENTENVLKDYINGFDEIGFYTCSCKELFAKPPPRSFKKWQVKDKNSEEKYDIIVHCAHKARSTVGEVYLEPIPEYQLELAASLQSQHKLTSIALSLLLRRRASLLNLRVDAMSGDLVTYDRIFLEEWSRMHGDVITDAANTIHTALNQLQGLVPGHYILQHEPSHGTNALLFASHMVGGSGRRLLLGSTSQPAACAEPASSASSGSSGGADAEDAAAAHPAPTLTPALLPMHKYRRVLPCAFTCHPAQLARDPPAAARRAARHKPPPPAIKWPKKKKKKKKAAN